MPAENPASGTVALRDLPKWIGQELVVSDWLPVDRAHLQAFAAASYLTDADVDLTVSRRNPLGADLVDGFLLLALLPHFHFRTPPFALAPGSYGFNYGVDRVRFLVPVMVGQRVRCRVRLLGAQERRPGEYLVKTEDTLELEGSEKPAMVAEWLVLVVTPPVAAPPP